MLFSMNGFLFQIGIKKPDIPKLKYFLLIFQAYLGSIILLYKYVDHRHSIQEFYIFPYHSSHIASLPQLHSRK